MNKIVISGYYGFDNLGDEAVLAGIIDSFSYLQKKLKITILSNQPRITSARYGVEAINRNDIKEIIKVISRSDLFVSGGGSLLQDITGLKSIPYYLGLVFLAQLLGKKTVFYAQGVGPIRRKINKKLVKWIGNRTDLITVRDSDSRCLLNEIGVKAGLIKETVDPVFGLEPKSKLSKWQVQNNNKDDEHKFSNNKNGFDIDSPLVGISVRPWNNDRYIQTIANGATWLAEKFGGQILIIPMYFDQDWGVSRDLKRLINNECCDYGVQIWQETCGPKEMLNIFSSLDFLIGVRLHSLIFAAVNMVPFVGISYDPKVKSFLDSFEFKAGIEIEECRSELLLEKIENVFSNKKIFIGQLEKKIKLWREKSQENAERVLNLL